MLNPGKPMGLLGFPIPMPQKFPQLVLVLMVVSFQSFAKKLIQHALLDTDSLKIKQEKQFDNNFFLQNAI